MKNKEDITVYKAFDDLMPEVQDAIKSKPIVDHKYRKAWHGKSCVVHGVHETVCGHHLIKNVWRGQRKASDCFIVPVCWICHREIHENEEAYFRKRLPKVDPREMCYLMYKEWRKRYAKS